MAISAAELAMRKKNTRRFISKDPKTIALIPASATEDAGSIEFADQAPRAAQTFRLIFPQIEGRTKDSDRMNYRAEFIILGEFNATLEINDHWSEGTQDYAIEWVQPFNGYEVKAGGVTHGSDPQRN